MCVSARPWPRWTWSGGAGPPASARCPQCPWTPATWWWSSGTVWDTRHGLSKLYTKYKHVGIMSIDQFYLRKGFLCEHQSQFGEVLWFYTHPTIKNLMPGSDKLWRLRLASVVMTWTPWGRGSGSGTPWARSAGAGVSSARMTGGISSTKLDCPVLLRLSEVRYEILYDEKRKGQL